MLEELAARFVILIEGEAASMLMFLGILLAGAGVAAILALLRPGEARLLRAPYFALWALTIFLAVAGQSVWLATPEAVSGGYLWVVVAISGLSMLIAGFCLCWLAMARARDGFGNAGMALFGFIPLLNLWLLFKPSEGEEGARRVAAPAMITGAAGVVIGLVLFIAGSGLNVYMEKKVGEIGRNADQITSGVTLLLRAKGLEETLRAMAAEADLPVSVDSATMLIRVEAEGEALKRTYVVSLPDFGVSDEFRENVKTHLCGTAPFKPLFAAGAAIHEIYVRPDGGGIGEVKAVAGDCGSQ
ncbi:MAG: hypothetical protein ACK5MQ_16565 [Pikeienuella sp.]